MTIAKESSYGLSSTTIYANNNNIMTMIIIIINFENKLRRVVLLKRQK